MIERKITNIIKNELGKVTAVGNPIEWWSPRNANEVVNDIEENFYKYYISFKGQRVYLQVLEADDEKLLTSTQREILLNQLAEISIC